jgi:hypothetical protein
MILLSVSAGHGTAMDVLSQSGVLLLAVEEVQLCWVQSSLSWLASRDQDIRIYIEPS